MNIKVSAFTESKKFYYNIYVVPFSLATRLCTYIYMFSVGLELGSPKNANFEELYVIFGKRLSTVYRTEFN